MALQQRWKGSLPAGAEVLSSDGLCRSSWRHSWGCSSGWSDLSVIDNNPMSSFPPPPPNVSIVPQKPEPGGVGGSDAAPPLRSIFVFHLFRSSQTDVDVLELRLDFMPRACLHTSGLSCEAREAVIDIRCVRCWQQAGSPVCLFFFSYCCQLYQGLPRLCIHVRNT